MNLRDIKKDIEYVLGAFIDDCSIFATINKNASDEELSKLLDEAVDLYNELKDKVNAKVEGKKGAYFSALRKEILEKTDALYEKLSVVVKNATETPAAAKKTPAKKAAAKKEETAEKVEKPAAKKAPAKKAAPKKETAEKVEKPAAAKKAPAKKEE